MNSLPLLSVIVPVYNVELYLCRCIDSIISQTYDNLEIILVDDGSSDRSGCICDEYALIDKRIKVVHQENQGLSGARNSGLNICKGEYIGFVDSDDFIHSEMYSRLYNDICRENVLLAFCQANVCRGKINSVQMNESTECWVNKDLIFTSISQNKWWSVCTKLYHRSLFDNIRFWEGKNNEDYPVSMMIFDKCQRIAVNYNKMYNYCIRENSICTSSFNYRKLDQIDTSLFVLEFLKGKYSKKTSQAAEAVLLASILSVYNNLFIQTEDCYLEKQRQVESIIKMHFLSGLKNPFFLWKQKILLITARLHPLCFRLFSQKKIF